MAAAAASGQIYENYDQVVVPDGTAPGAALNRVPRRTVSDIQNSEF